MGVRAETALSRTGLFRVWTERVTHDAPEKCAVRGVTYTTSADFFPEPLITLVRQKWEDDLGALVADLPPIDDILPVLEADVAQLLGET